MTPRYTWTPASEPPDDDRTVIVWCRTAQRMYTAWHGAGGWHTLADWFEVWRDVEPPSEGGART